MARNFSGSGDKIEVTDPNVGATNGITVAGWYRFETFYVNGPCITCYGNGNDVPTTDRGWALTLSPAQKVRFTIWTGVGAQGSGEGTTVLSANTWYHIAGVRDAGGGAQQSRVYLNGTSEANTNTDAIAAQNSTDDFMVGIKMPNVTLSFAWGDLDGDAEDVCYWNAALTAEEIFALSRGVRPYKIRTADQKVYLPITGVHSSEPNLALATHTISGTVTGAVLSADNAPLEPLFQPYVPFTEAAAAAGAGQPLVQSNQVMPRIVWQPMGF